MISRREVLQGGAMTALALALPFGRVRKALAGTPQTFDYYLSPTGDDNNQGTLDSPWSITALNSKQSIYGGKSVGLLPGTYQYGTVGGVKTTLYSLYQALPQGSNDQAPMLAAQGGNSSAPTYIASSDVSGNYNPRTAIIDCSDPSTGDLPTASASVLGQSAYMESNVSTWGYVTIDGLIIRNFTFAAIIFYGNATYALMQGIAIKNCELYNGQNVVSNNNPAAIFIDFGQNVTVQNCLIHDIWSNAPGSPSNMQACGYIQFNSVGTTIKNCTFYNCCSISNKDSWQSMDVSYCYCGWGSFGSPYSAESQYSNMGGTIHNYLCGAGETVNFHHNILIGPILGYGESGQANEGNVLIYNNTFYKPGGIGGAARGLMCFTDLYAANTSGGTGTFEFYNNLVFAEDGVYEGTHNSANPAAITKMGAETGGTWSTLTNCDYNAYGSGMTFGQGWDAGLSAWPLSRWLGYGYDKNSTTLSSSPFSGSPSEADVSSFAITGPATTAGKGGVACGALDGSGIVGCDFVSIHIPNASVLSVG